MSEKRALTHEREEQPAKAARHVEPQPQSDEKRRAAEQSSDIDSYLRAVAGNITDNEVIEDLGRELQFSRGDIQNFIRTNYRDHEITSYGTFCMLRKWSERVSQSSLRSDLKEALKRAEEQRTARAHLQSASVSEGKSTCLTPDEVLQLKKELLRYYQRMCSAVRTSPLYSESSMSLDDIYTNLAMFSKGMKDEKTDMKYGDFMKHLENICANKESKNRIVLFGEAGVGKTTFLAKLTLDWALGKCLEAIDLLFLIPLREIEENTSFGDIIMGKISDEVEFDGPRVEEHIRKNQRKVLILCDGLDEYSKDMEEDALKDDVIAVLRGNKYKCSPVVVTTRPWRAKEIESNTELEKRYKFVEIEGFKEKDVNSYIAKFFPDNKEAKDGLIRLMTDKDSLVAENMAPYPIFCSMLCFIWQNEGSRSVIQGLETFAQLFKELIQHLNDHYAGKEKSQKKKAEKWKQGKDSLQQFGKDALYCLLKNKLVFGEEDLTTRPNDLKTVCEIGVLTREERLVRRRENNRRRTEIVVEYQIPHKLFLEFLAGEHLAWLYGSNREEFNRINSVVMKDYLSFEYLLYFTVAQNKEVGTDVIISLCQMYDPDIIQYVDDDDDDDDYNAFLIDVAFECHEKDALEPMIPILNQVSKLRIARGHTGRGWIFVYKACDYLAAQRSDHSRVTSMDGSLESVSQAPGRGISLLSNLTSLYLEDARLDDDFFTMMALLAPRLKVRYFAIIILLNVLSNSSFALVSVSYFVLCTCISI
ncbi:NLR family CARD domain-containing protein 4-like [Diadema antillarum]|uniref:NLR family CARD domain-containing protein 4-like n=1 Tax=Diadema antillarum TaxID=105358 RepID=UPI003A88965E